jgi:hypothetical protein
LNILKPKKSFFLKREKKGDNNMYSLVYISDKCRPVINFWTHQPAPGIGWFLWFSYQPSIRSKTDFRLVWGRYIPMSGGSHFCENHQFWFLGLFWKTLSGSPIIKNQHFKLRKPFRVSDLWKNKIQSGFSWAGSPKFLNPWLSKMILTTQLSKKILFSVFKKKFT